MPRQKTSRLKNFVDAIGILPEDFTLDLTNCLD